MEPFFSNLGYFLMLCAQAVRDILWLRSILISAQASLVVYAVLTHNTTVAFWNTVFIVINAVQVARLVRERRPIPIPRSLTDLYDRVFFTMSHREFLYFWQTGAIKEICDDVIIREGERRNDLSLILSGTIHVVKDGAVIARLSRGDFMAEMSFLTGEVASATVTAADRVQYISWDQERLRGLKQLNPALLIKIQGILGRDLSHKIKAASE